MESFLNSLYFIVQHTMFFAIPLLVVAVGGMYSERSGVVNIALEGIMVTGAFFGILFIRTMQDTWQNHWLLLAAVLIAGICGCIYSVLHAFASVNLNADQTISGTALNMMAPALAIFVARMLFGRQQIEFASSSFHIQKVPILGDIPIIGPMLFQNTYTIIYLGLLIFALAAFVIAKTPFGLRLRACGEHPQAADSVGISVRGIRYAGVLISGFLGGIGGVMFVVPSSTNFNATVSGYGFLALAVLIFGGWRSGGIIRAAFFFGFMKTISSSSSAIPWLAPLNIPSGVYKMLPYIATLIVLAIFSASAQAPRAVGVPYDKGKR